MKKKITFPSWKESVGIIVLRDGKNGKQSVWGEYTPSEDDLLSLYATPEITGGYLALCENTEAAKQEENRRTAWMNALAFAEQLWRNGKHREFVVMFRPESPDGWKREAICIYQRLPQV